jgi:hypothetical protein
MTEPELTNDSTGYPQVEGAAIVETDVAGVMYNERHTMVPRLSLRERVRLIRQPDNAFDSNAIRIETQRGEELGFVARELAAHLAPYMDSCGQPIEATITELISDALGASFRVRIMLRLPTGCSPVRHSISSRELEYELQDSDTAHYVLINGTAAILDEVKTRMDEAGISLLRLGLCYRPANNGRLYQWYLKLPRSDGVAQETIERLFLEEFNVVSDSKKAHQLEQTKQKYQSEKLDLEKRLSQLRQDTKEFEELAEMTDTERRQRIHDLEVDVEHLSSQIAIINDEKRKLQHDCDSLKSLFQRRLSHFDPRSEDIPECVSTALLDIASESLSVSQSLSLISAMFSQRIVVLKRATESAVEVKGFREKRKAFELLWTLATTYWTRLANGQDGADAWRAFSPGTYAPKESESVERNPHTRRLRTFREGRKTWVMMKHLKIGASENQAETLRIHFEWDAERRVVVIGHCGRHLDLC